MILLIGISLSHVSVLIYNRNVHEYEDDNLCLVIMFLVPTTILTVLFLIITKYLPLVDWFGAILFTTFTLSSIYVNYAGIIPFENHTIVEQAEFAFVIPLFIYGGFLNLEVIKDLIVRLICWLLFVTIYYKHLEKFKE